MKYTFFYFLYGRTTIGTESECGTIATGIYLNKLQHALIGKNCLRTVYDRILIKPFILSFSSAQHCTAHLSTAQQSTGPWGLHGSIS